MSPVARLNIMVSSTRADLRSYRDRAIELIELIAREKVKSLDIVDITMEKETASGEQELAVDVSKRWVEKSDWIVLIVGYYYGTIPTEPAANGLSVTEWEYLHALETGKRVFVFMTGDAQTADAYQGGPDEANLGGWAMLQSEEQWRKARDFRSKVSALYLKHFRSRTHFIELLGLTLRRALDDYLSSSPQPRPITNIAPQSELANLLLKVRPSIQACINKVKSIASLKRLHDSLHDMRHLIILPLGDTDLPLWRSDGKLDNDIIGSISFKIGNAQGRVEAIRQEARNLSAPESKLAQEVERLTELVLDPRSALRDDGLATFAKWLGEFAQQAQKAFTLTDAAMGRSRDVLAELHTTMRAQMEAEQPKLTDAERPTFAESLNIVTKNKEHLIEILELHTTWQQKHDKLVALNKSRKLDDFDHILAEFLDSEDIDELAEREIENISKTLPSAPLLLKLEELISDLSKARDRPSLITFAPMRTNFDVAFYQVDKHTRVQIDAAEQRVRDVEDQLERLARAQLQSSPAR